MNTEQITDNIFACTKTHYGEAIKKMGRRVETTSIFLIFLIAKVQISMECTMLENKAAGIA